MDFEWDPQKSAQNRAKHGILFADAVGVFEDALALWQEEPGRYQEERFIALGKDYLDRVLVVVFTLRDQRIRLISARRATRREIKQYEQKSE